MKKDIHPTYHSKAKVQCACGAHFTIGSTKPEIKIEICGNCHPFYTGKEKLIDTMGRIERFKSRVSKKKESSPKKVRVKKLKK
jgi:large subunit ribosomal protein L31